MRRVIRCLHALTRQVISFEVQRRFVIAVQHACLQLGTLPLHSFRRRHFQTSEQRLRLDVLAQALILSTEQLLVY